MPSFDLVPSVVVVQLVVVLSYQYLLKRPVVPIFCARKGTASLMCS